MNHRSDQTFRRATAVLAAVSAAPLLLAAGPATPSTEVVNGSFEQPDIRDHSVPAHHRATTWATFHAANVPAWGVAPETSTIEIQRIWPAAHGVQYAELDSFNNSSLYQDIPTRPGDVYRLSYAWSPRPSVPAADNTFEVSAANDSEAVGGVAGGSTTSWRYGNLDFVATGTTTRIAFTDTGPSDGYGALLDAVSIQRVNRAPDCSTAAPSVATLWSPNHKMHDVTVAGATDPDGDAVSLTIDAVTQDEPVDELGSGSTAPDAERRGDATVALRAERSGLGDGRVYVISFTGTDGARGACTGTVTVTVPHDRKRAAVDSGQLFDSFGS